MKKMVFFHGNPSFLNDRTSDKVGFSFSISLQYVFYSSDVACVCTLYLLKSPTMHRFSFVPRLFYSKVRCKELFENVDKFHKYKCNDS